MEEACDSDSKTLYKVMAYVKDFNSMEAKVVYYGDDREIAIEYVRGYSRSGIYVHLNEYIEPIKRKT